MKIRARDDSKRRIFHFQVIIILFSFVHFSSLSYDNDTKENACVSFTFCVRVCVRERGAAEKGHILKSASTRQQKRTKKTLSTRARCWFCPRVEVVSFTGIGVVDIRKLNIYTTTFIPPSQLLQNYISVDLIFPFRIINNVIIIVRCQL